LTVEGNNFGPIWSYDGKDVYFCSNRGGDWDIYSQIADGSQPARTLLKRPYDQFTPFQILVPTTTILAAGTLSLMGYSTSMNLSQGSFPQLTVANPATPLKTATFAIAWPCAGIESLLIFTVTILLFLKRMPISWKAKAGYFTIGAAVTYFINILRIASIYLVALNGGDVNTFHTTYGPLYAIPWIVSYPLVILGTHSLI
jgi:exosortase/archaeosortase family protein